MKKRGVSARKTPFFSERPLASLAADIKMGLQMAPKNSAILFSSGRRESPGARDLVKNFALRERKGRAIAAHEAHATTLPSISLCLSRRRGAPSLSELLKGGWCFHKHESPKRRGQVSTDRSVVAALPLTTPRQVRKSSTDDSESRLRTEPLVYRELGALASRKSIRDELLSSTAHGGALCDGRLNSTAA